MIAYNDYVIKHDIRQDEDCPSQNYLDCGKFLKKNSPAIAEVISDYVEKTENCIKVQFSYKGENFAQTNLSFIDMNVSPYIINTIMDMHKVLMYGYTASEKLVIEDLSGNITPEIRNYYQALFNLEGKLSYCIQVNYREIGYSHLRGSGSGGLKDFSKFPLPTETQAGMILGS